MAKIIDQLKNFLGSPRPAEQPQENTAPRGSIDDSAGMQTPLSIRSDLAEYIKEATANEHANQPPPLPTPPTSPTIEQQKAHQTNDDDGDFVFRPKDVRRAMQTPGQKAREKARLAEAAEQRQKMMYRSVTLTGTEDLAALAKMVAENNRQPTATKKAPNALRTLKRVATAGISRPTTPNSALPSPTSPSPLRKSSISPPIGVHTQTLEQKLHDFAIAFGQSMPKCADGGYFFRQGNKKPAVAIEGETTIRNGIVAEVDAGHAYILHDPRDPNNPDKKPAQKGQADYTKVTAEQLKKFGLTLTKGQQVRDLTIGHSASLKRDAATAALEQPQPTKKQKR